MSHYAAQQSEYTLGTGSGLPPCWGQALSVALPLHTPGWLTNRLPGLFCTHLHLSICCALNENGPYRLIYLNLRSLVSGTV